MTTYTTRNRIIKPAQNEFKNTWGDEFNAGSTNMLDEALDGIAGLALTSSRALTTADGATDEARKRILNITSADAARTLTIPAVEKYYIVRNASSYTITFTVSGGGSTEVLSGQIAELFTDGTNIYRFNVTGWGLYSTTAATSGTTVTCTIDPNQHFTDMKILYQGVSANGVDTLRFILRDSTPASIGANIPVAGGALANGINLMSGSLTIENYRGTYGTGRCTDIDAATPASTRSAVLTSLDFEWAGAAIGSVQWSWTGGASFDASGSFALYLR